MEWCDFSAHAEERTRLAFDIQNIQTIYTCVMDFATLERGRRCAGILIAGTRPGVRRVPPCELRDSD